jgi:membrane glycosyltransferase
MMKDNQPDWMKAAKRRTALSRFLSFTLVSALTAVNYLLFVLYHYPLFVTASFLTAYFLLGYLGITYFWGNFFGLYIGLQENDPYHPENTAIDPPEGTKIAILFPVYQEDPVRVGAALGAMYEDLQKSGVDHFYDFFLLSDSRSVESVIAERWVSYRLQSQYPGLSLTYRHRAVNNFAKQGNIADFLRRWGHKYSFMLMLDADSIVPADTIWRMTRIMAGNTRIGIVQASLTMTFRSTLYARMVRYISSLTSKIGLLGQYFVQMGHGYYYGHNAMLRVDAFMKYCALPILHQSGPFQFGKPLSHDYVEASLLSGAGYEIWTLPELESYEELPTNFIDDMKREFRWMTGSMTYLRVFLSRKIHNTYKLRLFSNAITYFSPLLGWIFFFLALFGLRYIFLHPLMTHIIAQKYIFAFLFSLGFLVLSLIVRWVLPTLYFYKKGQLHFFGGFVKSLFSYVLFTIHGLIMGPILMAQLTKMLWFWARGEKMVWGTQERGDRALTWGEAWESFGWMSVIGVFLAWLVWEKVFSLDTNLVQQELNIPFIGLFIWYTPLLGGMILAPVILRFTSQSHEAIEKFGWFSSPTEIEKSFVLSRTKELEDDLSRNTPEIFSLQWALEDPWFTHHHLLHIGNREKKMDFWINRLPLNDIDIKSLSRGQQHQLLRIGSLWKKLHEQIWTTRIK